MLYCFYTFPLSAILKIFEKMQKYSYVAFTVSSMTTIKHHICDRYAHLFATSLSRSTYLIKREDTEIERHRKREIEGREREREREKERERERERKRER